MGIETLFYILGSLMAALAVVLSFIGLKAREFPSRRGAAGLTALFAAAVVATSGLAVAVARDEQQHRQAEQAEAEQATEESSESAPDGSGDGEAGDGSGGGESSDGSSGGESSGEGSGGETSE